MGDHSQARPLSQLLQDGVERAHISFGRSGEALQCGLLAQRGARRYCDSEAPIGVVLTNDQPTVELILGAAQANGTLISVPLPPRGGNVSEYLSLVRRIVADHQLGVIVARDDVAVHLSSAGIPARGHSELDATPLGGVSTSGGFTLVQYTSGTTGTPQGVSLSDFQLGANIEGLLRVLQPMPGDCAVSWLPLSHDMGLIGMLLTSLVAMSSEWADGGGLVLLDPSEFLRRPGVWLEVLSERQGTFTAAPDFGYRLATARQPGGSVNLGSVRCAIIGGEVVRSSTLHKLVEFLEPRGLSRTALCPAYGMAEVGLAITMTPPNELWRERMPSDTELQGGVVNPAPLAVSSGRPIAGYGFNGFGQSLTVGPISVTGPSIGTNPTTGDPLATSDGVLHTTDVGFLDDDGWLYVLGRDDDCIVVRGRNHFAPAVESAIARLDGIRDGRVAALTTYGGELVVAVETTKSSGRSGLTEDIERECAKSLGARPDYVVILKKGQMPLTSSGKLRRSSARALAMEMIGLGHGS